MNKDIRAFNALQSRTEKAIGSTLTKKIEAFEENNGADMACGTCNKNRRQEAAQEFPHLAEEKC